MSVATRPGWVDLINESVHTSDDMDIGDIMAANRDLIVVKKGFVNLHYYYIPISKVEGWDGHVIWLKISESDAKANYERKKLPDPERYYIKDYPSTVMYSTDYFPEVTMIPARYRPAYPPIEAPPGPEIPHIYRCDLCDTSFKTENQLSDHIKKQH